MEDDECCLCGDVGFRQDLIPCPLCGYRLQHIYCSSSYPNIDMKTWRCEWCIHDQDKQGADSRAKDSRPSMATTNRSSSPVDHAFPDATHHGTRTLQDSSTKSTRDSQDNKTLARSNSNAKASRKHKGAVDRPKKPHRCHSSLQRVAGRRYKLLADVLLCG